MLPSPSSRPGSSHNEKPKDSSSEPLSSQGIPLDRKRKPENGLSGTNSKLLKGNQESGLRHAFASTSLKSVPNDKSLKLSTSSTVSVPYRGTSKPKASVTTHTTPAEIIPKSAPKKGSFAEIMARAKTAQAATPAVGIIKHKPKETLSNKKEILLQKKGLSHKAKPEPKIALARGAVNSDVNVPGSGSSRPKKPVDAQVAGKKSTPQVNTRTTTAKPQPSYKGTMKPVTSVIPPGNKKPMAKNGGDKDRPRSRSASIHRPSISKERYRDYASEEEEMEDDEEDEEEGEEDAGSYESSDDMEAGFSDVEQEESKAAKSARKEDEEQAKIEAKLKKEKEDRKKRLEMMAKSAKKRTF